MPLDSRRKPEYLVRTHAQMQTPHRWCIGTQNLLAVKQQFLPLHHHSVLGEIYLISNDIDISILILQYF